MDQSERPLPVLARIPCLYEMTEEADVRADDAPVSMDLLSTSPRVLSQTAAIRLLIGIGLVLAILAISPDIFFGRGGSSSSEPTEVIDHSATSAETPQDDGIRASMDNDAFIADMSPTPGESGIAPRQPPGPLDEPMPQMNQSPPTDDFRLEIADRPRTSRFDGGSAVDSASLSEENPAPIYPAPWTSTVEPSPPSQYQYPSTGTGAPWLPSRLSIETSPSGGAMIDPPRVGPTSGHSTSSDRHDMSESRFDYGEVRSPTDPNVYR